MKNRFFLMGCLASLMLSPVVAVAQDSPLANYMDEMDGAYKVFRREQDPEKGAALAREAQNAVLKGTVEMPDLVSRIADNGAKAKAAADYRHMMGRLFLALVEVEQAFIANDLEKVAEMVEVLKGLKKEGHDQFMDD